MLPQLERPAMEGAGHIEGGIAVFEAAVAERQHDLALGHDPAVEIGDAVIAPVFAHCSLPLDKAPLPHRGRGWPPRQRRPGEGRLTIIRDLPPPPPPPPPRGGEGVKNTTA